VTRSDLFARAEVKLLPSNSVYDSLMEGIRARSIRVCVVGLGYVGLPTLAVIGSAGFPISGVDIRADIVERIRRGEDSIGEHGLKEALGKLVAEGKLTVTTDIDAGLENAGVVFVCVQTPVKSGHEPDLSFLEAAMKGLGKGLRRGRLVILGSTVPAGTTRKVVLPLLEKASGLKVGVDFWLAHCPERISPGVALKTFTERTRLVGGVDMESGDAAAEFLMAVGVHTVLEGEVGAVEVAKTAENTFRDVNIALANELALICEEVGVDVYEVIRLANTHERVKLHQPGAGVGGPCLSKDPYLLITPALGRKVNANLIQDSRLLNDEMPEHVIDLLVRSLMDLGMEVEDCVVGVLGVTFRGGTDDTRNSPAGEIIRGLLLRKMRVLSFDPLSKETFGSERVEGVETLLRKAQCVVVASDHVEFRGLLIPSESSVRLVVDGRRMLDPLKVPKGVRYVAVGDLTHLR
jgi:UDP-N-acetyl-D-mannosaminuronic acid dehydrogenase